MLDPAIRVNEARFWRTVAPMAMIFTPCQEGITHNNNERAEAGYTVPDVNVLLHAAAARADPA